jgi:hypothetical protein
LILCDAFGMLGTDDNMKADHRWSLIINTESRKEPRMINSSILSPAMTVCRSIVMDRGFVFLTLSFGLIITFSSQGLAQGDLVIYSDALAANWFDFPFGQTNYQNASPTHSGSRSISVRARTGEGIVLTHMDFDTSGYSDLSFWIHGGTKGGQRLTVMALLMYQPQTPVALDALAPGQWQLIKIPLWDLGVADRTGVNGFAVINTTEVDQPTFYLDDIRLSTVPIDPNKATYPNPANGADDVSISTDLSWNIPTAFTPTSYDVYFGTELDPYNNPKYTVYTNRFEPQGNLLYETTYYWVVDANDNGIIYPGDPWSFTTMSPVEPADRVAGNMMLINDNAGWCWYQDDKIIYDPVGGNILTSTAAEEHGFGGVSGSRLNDMDATTFNIATGKRTVTQARDGSGGGGDDHNMGAFWIRPDGRYLHFYCQHYTNWKTYYRLSTNLNDGSSWGSEQSYDWLTIPNSPGFDGQTSSYTNVHYLSCEGTGQGRLYNIIRIFTRTPCISYSDDLGQTWQYMGRLNSPVGGATYSNFYHKFRSNGVDRIDFIGVEKHPRNYNNSVYHGYIQNGKTYNSYGVEIDNINDQDAPSVQAFTPIFIADPTQGEGTYHTGWTNEIELDEDGYPVCLYQTRYGTEPWGWGSGQANIGAADHRFFYARFNGTTWTSTELGKMGVGLHQPEQDYIGMGCIHPDDANVVYISTPFDPCDDTEYEHYEIFKGVTSDKGLTWDWTQITFDSTENNVRPAIPPWDANNTAVFWTRGIYQQDNYEDYDLVLVGLVEEEDVILSPVTYIDANEINTIEADDSLFTPTGPSDSPGAGDDQWHEYTRYGNAGSVYTAGESPEDAPMLKTTISGLAEGTYDVFAYFWCHPTQDWGVVGGFAPSDMLYFSKQSSQQAEASQFAGPVDVIDIETAMYRVYIGRTQVSDGASVDVYIDDYDESFVYAPVLTTYDGVGVARVILCR